MSVRVSLSALALNAPQLDRRLKLQLGALAVTTLGLIWLVRDFDAPRVLLPMLVAAAAIPLLLRPQRATLLVLFLLYTNLPIAAYQVHGVPPALAASFAGLLALPLAAVLLVHREPIRIDSTFRLLLVFLGVLLLSSLFAPEPGFAVIRILTFAVEGLLLYWLIINVVRTEFMLRRVIWTLIAAGSLLGALSIAQAVTGKYTEDFGGLAQRKTYIEYEVAADNPTQEPVARLVASERAAGPFGEPNRYAQILIVLLPLAAVMHRHAGSRRARIAAAGAAALLLGGVLLSFSRGALLTLVALVPLAIAARWLRPLHLAALAVCVVLVSIKLAPGLGDRVASIGGVTGLFSDQPTARADGAIRGRATEMLAAAYVFLDHPLIGVGPGQYMPVYSAQYQQSIPVKFRDRPEPRRAHNLLLEIAAETGVIGLSVFSLILGMLIMQLRRARRTWLRVRPDRADLALAFILAIGAYLVTGLFLHLAFERYLWLLVALAAASLHVAHGRMQLMPNAALATATVAPPRRTRARLASAPTMPFIGNQTTMQRQLAETRNLPRVAYIMSRFPALTETFVLNEVLALEAMHVRVHLYPLLRERKPVQHPEAWRLAREAHYQPFISPRILRAQWFFLRQDPRKYLQVWRDVLRETWGSANFFIGAIGIFPKSVRFAYEMQRAGIAHVHAHFANHPAVAAYIIHRLTGIPYSFTAHGSDLHVERRMLETKVRASAFTVAISEYNRDLIVHDCGEDTRRKVHVVHCGIDPEVFSATGDRAHNGPLRIVCVASLQEVKGHSYLVEACRLLRERGIDFRCDLVGDGPLRGEIRRQVLHANLDGLVRMLGALPRAEVITMLRRADIAVLASRQTRRGKREGIPVALMEAMASELPVVASEISGIPELVTDGDTGILVPPADPIRLADALEKLARDPELRSRFGRRGREKVLREFDLRANARALLDLMVRSRARSGQPAARRLG